MQKSSNIKWCKNTEGKLIDLFVVQPTKTLLFKSFPCEQKAAQIRNQTVNCIRREETGNVTYMYLKNKKGKMLTGFEILFYVGITFIFSAMIVLAGVNLASCFNLSLKGYLYLATEMILGFSIPVANIAVNISNYSRYKKNIDNCETYLSNCFNKNDFQKIKTLGHNQLESLEEFLDSKELKAPLLYSHPGYNASKNESEEINNYTKSADSAGIEAQFPRLSIS